MENLELEVNKMQTKEIENSLVTGEQITEEKIEKSLSYDELAEEQKQAIDQFLSKIDVSNTAQILQFGASAQKNISQFSDTVLAEVKTKNVGQVGDLLSN